MFLKYRYLLFAFSFEPITVLFVNRVARCGLHVGTLKLFATDNGRLTESLYQKNIVIQFKIDKNIIIKHMFYNNYIKHYFK
jgi:hypothetical protein